MALTASPTGTHPAPGPASEDAALSVIELRRYRLHPGERERLIELFDRAFVEPQESLGMRIIGQFRDLDDADSFVWLRGFRDMPSRAEALRDFYTGPVWAAHRDQANVTMVNSDNVLLLRPAFPHSGFSLPDGRRPEPGVHEARSGLVVATIAYLAPGTDEATAAFFEQSMRPILMQASANVHAALVAERSPNSFPRLPVREGETVFVWLSSFPSLPAYESHLAALARSREWTERILPEMARRTWRRNEIWRLTPTGRSLLHG
jgi:hypothetical protein